MKIRTRNAFARRPRACYGFMHGQATCPKCGWWYNRAMHGRCTRPEIVCGACGSANLIDGSHCLDCYERTRDQEAQLEQWQRANLEDRRLS